MITFAQFKTQWLGHIVDFDHKYNYQCVDLPLQYIYQCEGINSGVSGNAIDYWFKTGNNGFNQILLSKFSKVANSDAKAGDIVVLHGLPGNSLGHIGIATGNINASEVEILEQNGATGNGLGQGGDRIRTRFIARSRVAGLLRPIAHTPAPSPAPTHSADSIVVQTGWGLSHVAQAAGYADATSPARWAYIAALNGSNNWQAYNNALKKGQVVKVRGEAPAPVAPPAPVVVHPYTIENITPKQVKLNKNTHLWGLNYDNLTAIKNNPQAEASAGTTLTVYAILHHNIGYKYYLTDPHTASGYNVVDCDDYTAPPAPPAPPPPPPPNPKPPAGPLTAPSSEIYEVIKDVGGFFTSNQAVNHISQKVTVPTGTYFVFNKRFDSKDSSKLIAINLTKTPGKPGAWINPLDNIEEPAPPEPKPEELTKIAVVTDSKDFASAYKPLIGADGQPKPQVYVAMRDVSVINLADNLPLSKDGKLVTMPKYSVSWICGTLPFNNTEYAILKSAYEKGLWYGIEWVDPQTSLPNIELESDVYSAKTTVAERQATKTLKKEDHAALIVASFKKFYLGFTKFLGKIRLAKKIKK